MKKRYFTILDYEFLFTNPFDYNYGYSIGTRTQSRDFVRVGFGVYIRCNQLWRVIKPSTYEVNSRGTVKTAL